MKRLLLMLLLLQGLHSTAIAAPGDTTWVHPFQTIQMVHHGAFDTTALFPDGSLSYRNIYMTFTLGKYQCPSGATCGEWDYTVRISCRTKSGDTLELGRLITPYAHVSGPRTPWSWTQRYIFDVTDYYHQLQDSADIVIFYDGYSFGFTADLKFAFVEGTPARSVTGITRLYDGGFAYGNASQPIENYLTMVTDTTPAGTSASEMNVIITGHGADANYCSEFCSKYYQILLDNNFLAQKDIWRADCGRNHLYPQTGTWLYDRANWCPGDQVQVNSHNLPGLVPGLPYRIDMDMEPYTTVPGSAGPPLYIISAQVVHYGPMNKTLDADLLDIVAPNSFEAHFRENALCGKPKVRIRNTGAGPIDSLTIEYGVEGHAISSYHWSGTLPSLKDTLIELPALTALHSVSGDTATRHFMVRLAGINGQTDADTTNNRIAVPFKPAPRWPAQFIVRLITNNATQGGVSETNWKVTDLDGNIVRQRNNAAAGTTYNDTLNLPDGCYRLIVEDAGCDGLSFWANPGVGSGSILVRTTTSFLPFKLAGYFSGDFGCGFSQDFTVGYPTAVGNLTAETGLAMQVFPNPARQSVTVQFAGTQTIRGTLRIVDALGRVVLQQPCRSAQTEFSVGSLPAGVYTIIYQDGHRSLPQRLLIAR